MKNRKYFIMKLEHETGKEALFNLESKLVVFSHSHGTYGIHWGTEPENFTMYDTEEDAKKDIKLFPEDSFITSICEDDIPRWWGTHKAQI